MVGAMHRSALLLAALLIGSAARSAHARPAPPSAPAASPSAADARFKALYEREWAWRQAQRGEVDEDDDPSRVRRLLPKVDAKTQAERLAYWRGVMGELAAIDPHGLSAAESENYAVYRAQIQVLINQQVFRDWEKPLTGDSAFWSDMTGVARQPFRRAADYPAYLSQLNDLPRYFDEEIADMRAGLRRGFTPPRVTLDGSRRSDPLDAIADAKVPEDTEPGTPLSRRSPRPRSRPQDAGALCKPKPRAGDRREQVQPAYRKLLRAWLHDGLLSRTRGRQLAAERRSRDGQGVLPSAQILRICDRRR